MYFAKAMGRNFFFFHSFTGYLAITTSRRPVGHEMIVRYG